MKLRRFVETSVSELGHFRDAAFSDLKKNHDISILLMFSENSFYSGVRYEYGSEILMSSPTGF